MTFWAPKLSLGELEWGLVKEKVQSGVCIGGGLFMANGAAQVLMLFVDFDCAGLELVLLECDMSC